MVTLLILTIVIIEIISAVSNVSEFNFGSQTWHT